MRLTAQVLAVILAMAGGIVAAVGRQWATVLVAAAVIVLAAGLGLKL